MRHGLGLTTKLQHGRYDEDHPDESMLMADAQTVTLIFFQRNEKTGRTPVVVFTLAEGGIDDVIDKLASRGATIVLPVSEAPGGWTSDFTDPDEHMLSFYQSNQKPRRLP